MGNQNRVIEIQNQSGDQKHSSAKVKGLTISSKSRIALDGPKNNSRSGGLYRC